MKKLLPLLFLVACTGAGVETLENSLRMCGIRAEVLRERAELVERDFAKTQVELVQCKNEVFKQPALIRLPVEPRPQLDLTDCVYLDRMTFCKESTNKGPWFNFDCRNLVVKNAWYCLANSCAMITSDSKWCSL